MKNSVLSSKTNTSKFQFDLETVDEEPPRGNATVNSYYYYYYYYYIIITVLFDRNGFSFGEAKKS